MRVYNLTDVPTPVLEHRKLVGHSLLVGSVLLLAGAYCDVPPEKEEAVRMKIRHLEYMGAVSIDRIPEYYAKARSEPDPDPPEPPLEAA